MKKFLLVGLFLVASPAAAFDYRSTITDSVQLTVDGPAIQTNRLGSSYSVSVTNVKVHEPITRMAGQALDIEGLNISGCSNTAASGADSATWEVNTAGQAFSFNESFTRGDDAVTSTTISTSGRFGNPTVYGESIVSAGGTAGTLAGTLSPTGIPTVTAGGPGTTAIGQRTVDLSVFH